MAWTPFNILPGRLLECYLNGATPPAPNSFFLVLTNGGTIDANTPLASVYALEVSGFGYARANYDPSAGSYDGTQSRYEMPPVTVSYTASGGAIVFDKAVLVGGTGLTGTGGELVCFQAQASPTTIPDGTTYSFLVNFNLGGASADVNAA